MFPAYSIPLTEKDLILLGELTVILGMVDEEMVVAVSGLIQADRPTTAKIMGSTQIANNAAIWASLINLRCSNIDILWLVDHAQKEIAAVSAGRNDFIHAFYRERLPSGAYTYSSSNEMVELRPETSENTHAMRVRNSQNRPVSELATLHERAARLSCLVAHIGYKLAPHGEGREHTPWLGRLLPTLPPRPPNWEPEKGIKIAIQQRS
jgi:hypothetical protein